MRDREWHRREQTNTLCRFPLVELPRDQKIDERISKESHTLGIEETAIDGLLFSLDAHNHQRLVFERVTNHSFDSYSTRDRSVRASA